nr:sulfatase-like hydrolase/transferase [Paraglaciecola sp. 20A4]
MRTYSLLLLTGTDNHTGGLGAQIIFSGHLGQPGYEGYLSNRVVTTAEVLDDEGYHTYMSGKWHLGFEDHQSPHSRVFQDTFIFVPGGGSHFSDLLPIHARTLSDTITGWRKRRITIRSGCRL